MSTLGRNIAFPIYNGDGTPFHDLVMRKSAYDSVVMSLSDKVIGDVYYKDNTLTFNMNEYIMLDGVKFMLVNPSTIVREGLKADNGELKGMTKYSLEFYHPMYLVGNIPFTDVAVNNGERIYKSHDRTFAWIGNLTDYVAKLNKNLQGTQFIVSISNSIDASSRAILSDVLPFNDNTIADALKTGYDTWHFPYVVDAIKSGEPYYADGKRFLIQFGNPTREILDANNQPFVFRFGQGVGLKNNSRTPRNNKIVTRVAGYGSEQNIPYGYPQIVWTGDASATQTADGYPIYDGIVGGVVTKLVKHPFTRNHLMPSVYVESVRKKVDSAAPDYDNTIELIDYYDAPSTYPNPINLDAPKYDIVQIDSIKPELGDMTIVGAEPVNDDLTPASGWDDTMDDDGKYKQSYFKLTIPQLDFDVYACASITEEMKINMRSGACIGCTFDAQVDWDDYKKNFFDAQGNFLPDGEQRDLSKYPKSNNGSIDLIVKKDLNTYGTLMPNVYQYPAQGDKFVILGISLPNTYITNAQVRLDDAIMAHMLDNNVYYYDYPLKFDEDFLLNRPNILSQIRTNTVLRFMFGNLEKSLYVKQITIKYGEGVLPKYDITLTDNIEVVLNQIGLVADDVSRLALAMMQMNKRTNINITNTESLQKYVDYTIMPKLESIQKQIDGSQVTYFGNEDPFDASHPYSDGKYIVDPTKFPASEWDDDYSEHDGDMFYNRDSGKGYEFTIIDNSTSPVVYGWQLIQDEDIIQALTNAQNAQDTADGKRRVFICDASHHTPNPPYDVGDLWVNVKYPYATGATYDDEILKCVVAKTEDQTFDISDWSLANGYTAALRNFINGTYADNLREIQYQIDGKAETWYQNTDPSTAWTTTALKNQHKGDIWHNSSTSTINGVKAGQDAIWNGTAWVVDETVPQAVYDEIDGKCAIYIAWGAWGNDLQEKDLFIPAADTTQGGTTYKANKVYRCVDKDTPTFQEIAYTDDTQYNGFITKLIGSSGQTKDAAENALAAIKHALSDGNTYNEGGLILSNLISLGTGNPLSGTFTPWAGISGIYKTSETGTGYKGNGIAAWFGGGMIDKEVSDVSNAAKSLFRFDGSGYVSSGNLSWDKNGNVTIQGNSINATTLKVGGANVATQAMLDNFVSKAFFNRLFTAYDANGNAIVPNDTTTAISNLKLMVGTWTEQYLSVLGLNSQGGGGGTGDVSHIKVSTNPDVYLDPDSDGIIDMSDYVSTIAERNIWNTANANINRLMARVPSATFNTGNELADKNFVNSSISTSTATFRGTNTTATTESAFLTWANGLTHDLNDYVFWSTKDSAGNTIYKRYKYDGSQWVFEYDLNNSSFTSDQWSAINSGINTSLVTKLNGIAAGAQVNVIESVKVNGTALSISSKAVDITAVPLSIITGADDLKAIEGLSGTSGFLKKTAANTWALDTTVVLNTRSITAGTGLTGGGNLQADRTISLATSGVSAGTYRSVTVDTYGRVTAGTNPTTISGYGITDAKISNGVITLGSNTITPVTSVAMTVPTGFSISGTPISKTGTLVLTYASGYEGFTTTLKEKINLLYSLFTREGSGTTADPYVIKANYGLYSEQFLSALGQNTSGGSGSGVDLSDVWNSLTNEVSDNYSTTKIHTNHIPDVSSIYGYLKSANLDGYVNAIATTGTGDAIIAVTKSGSTITFAKGGSFASASSVTTLQGYFTNGVANNAARLSNTTKIGDTNKPVYFTANGVPAAISYTIDKSVPSNAVFTDTTYSAGTGISLSGTTFSNSGVRAVSINGNYLRVNTNGTNDDLTIPFATSSTSASYASKVVGSYTSNGGQQNPNYFGTNRVGFLMMKTTVNGNSQYKDWLIMDCYNGNDVGGGVAIGVNRQALGAYIMRSESARTSWAASAELLGTHNYASYAAKKTEAIKSISRSGTTFTATRCDDTTFTFTQQDNNTWRGIQDNLTSSTNTTESLSAKQGYLLANGSARDNTKLPLAGGTMTGTITARDITIQSAYKLKIGDAILAWDSTNNALKVYKLSGTTEVAVNLYATGAVSALGVNTSGGGGGAGIDLDAMWGSLMNTISDTYASSKIAAAHIPDMASTYGYVKSSGVTSVATGTGLTGGTITSTGTISINSTYQTYISHGESAYNSLSNYLPLSGGTMTGSISRKMSTDTSNYVQAIRWVNTSGTEIASIAYHNTVQNLFLYPKAVSDAYIDAVGKYGLRIGINALTYNTYTIYHSNNLGIGTLMGSLSIGGSTTPVYWNGSAWTSCTAYASANVNYATSSGNADTVDNLHASSFLQNYNLNGQDVTLSDKVWSFGVTNKGDHPTQTECPTNYGAYISLQYKSGKNHGFQIYGNTSTTTPTVYVRNRLAGDSNTSYNTWKALAFADGTGASGTWGISITGNSATATKATQDGSGNTITSTYLRLSSSSMQTLTSSVQSWVLCFRNTYNGNTNSEAYIGLYNSTGMHIRSYTTSSAVYILQLYNSNKEIFGVYADGTIKAAANINVNGNLTVSGEVTASKLKIGDAILAWDSTNNALKVYKLSGTTEVAVNLYATGAVSALGVNTSGGGGGAGIM